ncbi:hypothetical protein VitviT2T_015794 [Vitis vinifera]|uniref:Cytochrome b/b6 N-terminal region profile domain-containing protein n=1 Tax=Vitis vinifera TaxID=29760 RepID=A0ABY9CNQ6_VITVI|nr:hypothetical protein VitviT2T_015794 [Vitis vinifera]
MTFDYRPTVTEAFASVQYIMTEANFGWLIRSVHRWSASMMVLMMILHVFRVYLTGIGIEAWKRNGKIRELAWTKFPLLVWTTTIESVPLPRLCLIQAFNRKTYNPSHKGKDLITRTRNKEGRRKATPTGKGSLDVSKAEVKANRTYRRKMGEEILLGLEERLLNFYGRMLKRLPEGARLGKDYG